jgi:Domain of unknown function (DUF4956)
MFDFLKTTETAPLSEVSVVLRLLGALVLGLLVAWVYRRTRPPTKAGASLQVTLVLLSILIATVTMVVGNNPARAFSLVGALSIIRFRTIVQDTQDTAYVIFAVVMGMAAGANAPWIAGMGFLVVGFAAFVTKRRAPAATIEEEAGGYRLNLRIGLGHDLDALLASTFTGHLSRHRLISMETARQGTAIDVVYKVQFRADGSPDGLLKALNRLDGVQNVQLEDSDVDDD